MEAKNLEATPDETEAAMERQEVFEEEINFDTNGPSEDRYKNQRLAVPRHRGAKKRSEDSDGSRQKVSATRKRVIRHAVPAVRKGKILMCPGKTTDRILRNTLDKDVAKRARLSTNMLTSLFDLLIPTREINENAFWKIRPPSIRKKELRTGPEP
jgi:hypothetical protein